MAGRAARAAAPAPASEVAPRYEAHATFGNPAPTSAAALALLNAGLADEALVLLRADPAAPATARHQLATGRLADAAETLREAVAAARADSRRETGGGLPE